MKLVALILFLFFSSNIKSKENYSPELFKLKNGMKVLVLQNKRAPVIAQMIWYEFGSDVEERGKSGLAHFMEHLMFKGTKKFPDSSYSDFISKIGGSENAFTSYDYTAYYQIFPKDKLKEIIQMEADRMTNLTLTKKNVEIEKNVILEERFQRIESDPSSKLDESMRSVLFPNHYYGRPIIGWKHEIEDLNFEDVIKFYKKHYIPNNATLVLSGDVDLNKAKKFSKKYFGRIKKGRKLKKNMLIDPDMSTNIFVGMKHSTVKQDVWKKFYRTHSYKDNLKDSISLDLGLKILVSGSSSLLYKILVEEKKLFSVVGGYYQGMTKGEGSVYLYAIPKEKLKLQNIDKIIMNEIKEIIKKGIDEKRFDIEKKRYFYDIVYNRDGILNPAQIFGESLTIGLKIDDILKWNENLNDIKIDDVEESLLNFFSNKNYVVGGLSN